MSGIDAIAKGMGWFTKTRPMQALGAKWAKDPEGVLGAATVTSIILKDGIGCAMYVTQSLNNDRIPEEKRKFVAALDLTNGLLMILAQIGMFLAMRKYSGKIFDKMFSKTFNKIAQSQFVSRVRMWAAKAGEPVMKKLKLQKLFEENKDDALSVFKFVLDISAATIIGKRVIVPLIATPWAKKVEKMMNKGKDDAHKEGKDVENTYDKKKHFGKPEKPAVARELDLNTVQVADDKKSPFDKFKLTA